MNAAAGGQPLGGTVGLRGEGYQHDAGCVLVQPGDDTRSGIEESMGKNPVEQGAGDIAVRGMNHDPGRLVDGQQPRVFEQHVERNLFG